MAAKTYPEYSTQYPLTLRVIMQRPVSIYPDETGVVYRNPDSGEYQRFTWREWYERTCQLGNALRSLGIEPGGPRDPGDRVGILAQNHHRHLELYYAAPCIGAVMHSIVPRLSLDHITHTIRHSEDKVLFFDDILLPLVELVYDRVKDVVEKFIYMSDGEELPETKVQPLYNYERLLKEGSPDIEWPYLSEDNYANLCYTTGTTGLPKGVMFTHRQLYLHALHVMVAQSWAPDPDRPSLGDREVPMLNTPFCHGNGWGMPHFNLFAARKLVLPGRFTPDGFCDLVQTEKVTSTSMVPTMLAMLVEYEDLKKYDLSSLQSVGVGGAALSPGLKSKAEQLIPGFSAASAFGQTETCPVVVAAFLKRHMRDWPKEEQDKIRVKAGLPMPAIEVRIVDENGQDVPRDNETIGEIVLRGPWIMEEYYNEPEKTEQVWYDGWYHTGDVARVDEEGYITIADRVRDVIRSGAEMIPTVLLENLTAASDAVLEATYVGVPDDKWGERPMGIIKLAPGASKTEEEIYNFLETQGVAGGKLAKFMLPDFIAVVDEIPKTSVGKYDKIEIKKNLDDFLSRAKKMR